MALATAWLDSDCFFISWSENTLLQINLGEPPQAPGTNEHMGKEEKNFLLNIGNENHFGEEVIRWKTGWLEYGSVEYGSRAYACRFSTTKYEVALFYIPT